MLQGLLQSTHVISVFELSVYIYRTRFIALPCRTLGYCSLMETLKMDYATFDVNSIPIFRYVGTNTSGKKPCLIWTKRIQDFRFGWWIRKCSYVLRKKLEREELMVDDEAVRTNLIGTKLL